MTDRKDPTELEDSEPLLERESENALAEALSSAFAPTALEPARHAEILAMALEDPLAPATEEELRASERLRRALESGDEQHQDAALARALTAATNPVPLSPAAERRLLAQSAPRRPKLVYVTFGAVALAAAAAFALFIARPSENASASPASLVASRSTQNLFSEPFATGQASARIDRIASARERDARENRYALWGVR